jgi:multiple sugar transport system permease protein
MIWSLILNPASGLIKTVTTQLGLGTFNILGSSTLVMPLIIMITFTVNVGQAVILYIAAFVSIPPDILEAAEVDGANRWVKFKNILFPMSKPTTLYVMITNIIAVLKIFVIIQLLTAGGPNNASVTLMYYLYQKAFEFNQVGQGSAVGVIMFAIALILSIFQFKLFRDK